MSPDEALANRHAIPRYAVDSSTVKSIGYDVGVCVVEFANGNLYAYPMNVEDFEAFAAAESKGRHFNTMIRGKVSGEKLTGRCSQCGSEPEVKSPCPCPECGGVVRQVDKVHKPA